MHDGSQGGIVTKAVIPAAGLGTRFLPATKSMPKEMLPIIDKPAIHFVIEEAVLSDIDDILIITGRGKRAIEDYFDATPELENHLAKSGKYELLKQLQEISSLANIHYIRQKELKGLDDAVLKAKKHVGNEPFAVLLGDDIVKSEIPCIKQLKDLFETHNKSIIAIEKIPREKISNYGIIRVRERHGPLYVIDDLIEKPTFEEAPSGLGAIGRYIFTPKIFDCLEMITVGKNNEIQLTDAIKLLKEREEVLAYEFHGRRFDIGNRFGYIRAIMDFALGDDDLKKELKGYLDSLTVKHG